MPRGRKTGGRKKGTENKVDSKMRFDLMEALKVRNFEPATALVEIYEESMKLYRDKLDNQKGWGAGPALDTAQKCAATLMEYVYPKRKSVELTGKDGADVFQSFTAMIKEVADGDGSNSNH